MITSKELLSLSLAVIILAFSNSFINSGVFFYSLIFFAVIMLVYVASKKALSYYFETQTEEKIWSAQRYWFNEGDYLKTPIPLGLILPFVLSIVSLGYIKWFAVTETELSTTPARAARRHDFYSYSELTEWHIALISAIGIVSVLILSFIAYLINQPSLAKLAVFFAVFNMIPIGKLDGTKIFFGSVILYLTLLAVSLIALSYALLIV